MRLVSYQISGENRIGVMDDGSILDLERAYYWMADHTNQMERIPPSEQAQISFRDMVTFLQNGDIALAMANRVIAFVQQRLEKESSHLYEQEVIYSRDRVRLLPPLQRPGKIICVGMNYPDPGSNSAAPQYPVLFLKAASSIIASGETISLPDISEEVNYEGELGLIMAQGAKGIPEEKALDFVAGYTIVNDVGAGDLERRTSQWTSGKIFDTFLPLGPALVTREEIKRPDKLDIRTSLNGRIVQDGNTNQMIFGIPFLVSYISRLTTLEPGDLILTGSPKSVGQEPAPRIPLRPGDEVQIEIEDLGRLINPVQAVGS